eukprot:9013260-Alexandrium_andersonii.AAC.1
MVNGESPDGLSEIHLHQLPFLRVPTHLQLADCLTKDMNGEVLRTAIATGRVRLQETDAGGPHSTKTGSV